MSAHFLPLKSQTKTLPWRTSPSDPKRPPISATTVTGMFHPPHRQGVRHAELDPVGSQTGHSQALLGGSGEQRSFTDLPAPIRPQPDALFRPLLIGPLMTGRDTNTLLGSSGRAFSVS